VADKSKCPYWWVCKSPSKNDTWICIGEEKDRLISCVCFVAFQTNPEELWKNE